MDIKNLINSSPFFYISYKSRNFKEAIELFKGYKAIKKYNLFDDDFYLDKYPKVKSSGMDPLLHYLFFGFEEGKKPSSDFDALYYLNKYDDVNINPLVHYSLYGIKENRLCKIPKDLELSKYINHNKDRILFVLHENPGKMGGVGLTNLDIISGISDDFQIFLLISTSEDIELWEYDNGLNKIYQWEIGYNTDFSIIDFDNNNEIDSGNFEDFLFNKDLKEIYDKVLSSLDIGLIHINSLINHSFDLPELAFKKDIPYILHIHDFYYLCPSIHLLNNNYSYCNLDCLNNKWNCGSFNIDNPSKFDYIVNLWRRYHEIILENASSIIVSSYFTMETYKKFYPKLNNFKIIPLGRDFKNFEHIYNIPDKKPVKIVFPGHISPHKGSLLIKEIKNLDKDNNFEFHFVGTSIPSLNDYGINHGRYKRNEFNNIVKKINPSFIAIFSTCPETFSHTLTESWALGIPVIATNLGALAERIKETNGGYLVDYANPKLIYNQLLAISNNEEEYIEKVKNISKIKFKSKNQMITEFKKIYGEIFNG